MSDKNHIGDKGHRRFLATTLSDDHFAIDRAEAEEDVKFDGLEVCWAPTPICHRLKRCFAARSAPPRPCSPRGRTFTRPTRPIATMPRAACLPSAEEGVGGPRLGYGQGDRRRRRRASGSSPAILADLNSLTETEVEQDGKPPSPALDAAPGGLPRPSCRRSRSVPTVRQLANARANSINRNAAPRRPSRGNSPIINTFGIRRVEDMGELFAAFLLGAARGITQRRRRSMPDSSRAGRKERSTVNSAVVTSRSSAERKTHPSKSPRVSFQREAIKPSISRSRALISCATLSPAYRDAINFLPSMQRRSLSSRSKKTRRICSAATLTSGSAQN